MNHFARIVLLFVIALTVGGMAMRGCEHHRHRTTLPLKGVLCAAQSLNAEAKLACGELVALHEVDESVLELIPGISRVRAESLLASRAEIQRRAATLKPDERYRAFELAPGIGPVTARALGGYLEVIPSPGSARGLVPSSRSADSR